MLRSRVGRHRLKVSWPGESSGGCRDISSMHVIEWNEARERAGSLRKHSISFFYMRDAFSDFVDDAGGIAAQDVGVRFYHHAVLLDLP